jgi:hypothetical protein
MSQQTDPDPTLFQNITAAAHAAHHAERTWRLRMRARDELVAKAVNAGRSQRSVAAAAGVSKGRIVGIMTRTAEVLEAL